MAQTPYNRALDLLAARPYTVREMRRKLSNMDSRFRGNGGGGGNDGGRNEVAAADVEAVIQRLVAAGLLDDARYAVAYARSRLIGQGASARRIGQDLARKGIAAELSKAAIAQVIEDEEIDTRAAIERVARKKLASMGALDPVTSRRRLFAFLARRGYDLDEIREVMAAVGES